MKILCTICVRGGSKSVKNKNIKLINNKPLIYYSIQQAKKSNLFEDIVISTDSKKIQNISKSFGVKNFFLRPRFLSTSSAPKIPVIRHALYKAERHYKKKYDYIIDLDATSPLRLVDDMNCKNIIIDRQPMLNEGKTTYSIQKVPFWFGGESFAVKLYNYRNFINIFNKFNFFLVDSFNGFGNDFKNGKYICQIYRKH